MAEDTVQKAIEKLRAEIDKNKKDGFVEVIGEFLIKTVQENPEAAEKILDKDKTISNSINEMSKEARKKSINGHAMLSDQEGFQIVLKYFGINAAAPEVINQAIKEEPKKEESRVADFNYSLDDFL